MAIWSARVSIHTIGSEVSEARRRRAVMGSNPTPLAATFAQ
jgi:hypothetical protein